MTYGGNLGDIGDICCNVDSEIATRKPLIISECCKGGNVARKKHFFAQILCRRSGKDPLVKNEDTNVGTMTATVDERNMAVADIDGTISGSYSAGDELTYYFGSDYYHGVHGVLFTSTKPGNTDKSIFRPASGCMLSTTKNYLGAYLYYWTSTLYTGKASRGRNLYYLSGVSGAVGLSKDDYGFRYDGFPVRAVQEK